MTLIAFATYGTDRAEIITDTCSYTARLSQLGRTMKHQAIPHLDALVAAQGDSRFTAAAACGMFVASDDLGTFDELVDFAPEALQSVWQSCLLDGTTPADAEGTVFLLGYSSRHEKFVAWGFAAEQQFQPFKIPGLYVMPAPWGMRPSRLELERVRTFMTAIGNPHTDRVTADWAAQPARPAPRSPEEWRALALEVRQHRALGTDFARVVVAGDVFHTKIRRGSVETRQLHRFNDAGQEFLQLINGSEHPLALAAPCHCGSSRPFAECCAPGLPCGCGSNKPFGDCCQPRGVSAI